MKLISIKFFCYIYRESFFIFFDIFFISFIFILVCYGLFLKRVKKQNFIFFEIFFEKYFDIEYIKYIKYLKYTFIFLYLFYRWLTFKYGIFDLNVETLHLQNFANHMESSKFNEEMMTIGRRLTPDDHINLSRSYDEFYYRQSKHVTGVGMPDHCKIMPDRGNMTAGPDFTITSKYTYYMDKFKWWGVFFITVGSGFAFLYLIISNIQFVLWLAAKLIGRGDRYD